MPYAYKTNEEFEQLREKLKDELQKRRDAAKILKTSTKERLRKHYVDKKQEIHANLEIEQIDIIDSNVHDKLPPVNNDIREKLDDSEEPDKLPSMNNDLRENLDDSKEPDKLPPSNDNPCEKLIDLEPQIELPSANIDLYEKLDDFKEPNELPNINVNLSENNGSFQKHSSARARERALRREIESLEKQLHDLTKKHESLKRELKKSNQTNNKIINKNRRLSNELEYCKSVFEDLKITRDQIKKSSEKRLFNQFVSGQKRRRVYSKNYNLTTKHYQKSKKVDTETKSSLKKKALRLSVRNFFESDENSCLAPGSSQHFITRKKVRKRKRYYAETLQNLHKKYCNTVGMISRSLFYMLKPWWIKKMKITARETCLCIKHENMTLKFQRIRRHKLTEVTSLTDYLTSICCDTENENCMNRTCKNCKTRALPTCHDQSDTETHYYCWKSENVKRKGAKDREYDVKVMSRHKIECTLSELVEEFNKDIVEFTKHAYSTDCQYKSLDKLKENIEKDEAYIVIDFSQNYNCKYGREIHGAHFGASKKQVSLHSGGFYYKNEKDEIEFESFAVVSDDLTHDAVSVWALLEPILKRIKELMPNVKTIHFQSDGPSTQYKNKTNFYLLHYFAKKLGLEHVTWNFTTAGHGKSVADAIGGTCKAMCDRFVANGNDITCASDMWNFLNSSGSKIKCYLITTDEITEIRKLVPDNLKAVKHTTKVHQVVWDRSESEELFFRYLTCTVCTSGTHCDHHNLPESKVTWSFEENDIEMDHSSLHSFTSASTTFQVNEWICVIYDGLWYPGLITQIEDDEMTVTYLKRWKKLFVWPDPLDIQIVLPSQVLSKINEPEKVGCKGKKECYSISIDNIKYLNELVANCEILDD